MKIIAIETSCDETSVAVIQSKKGKLKILSNVITSQIDIHKKYGGVVPEVASRAHIETVIPVVEESLKKAKVKLKDIDAVAVTTGPGLIGSLLVGVNTAKTISYLLKKPLIPVNHLEGHIYANFVGIETKNQKPKTKNKISNSTTPKFPLVCLLASGGHTMLVYMKEHLNYRVLGQTLDDAAGEAFDKVAKILDIGYPGGPIIEKLAKKGNPKAFDFPRAEMEGKTYRDSEGYLRKLPPNLDFSFSGVKTAVLNLVYKLKGNKVIRSKNLATYKLSNLQTSDIAASFQEAVINVLVKKTIWAAERTKAKSILISGGVASNSFFRKEFKLKIKNEKLKINLFAPEKILCTDNAAMIAAAAYFKIKFNKYPKKTEINPNLKLK